MSKKIEVFDPPMCCSSGVCGTNVNPELVRFSGDLKFLKMNGIAVTRYNLSSEPTAFVQNKLVQQTLNDEGNDCLPLVLVDGTVISKGRYPARTELLEAAELDVEAELYSGTPEIPTCGPGCRC